MAFKIGFMADRTEKKEQSEIAPIQKPVVVPKKSVVQVRFPGKGAASFLTIDNKETGSIIL